MVFQQIRQSVKMRYDQIIIIITSQVLAFHKFSYLHGHCLAFVMNVTLHRFFLCTDESFYFKNHYVHVGELARNVSIVL